MLVPLPLDKDGGHGLVESAEPSVEVTESDDCHVIIVAVIFLI